eukprot:scaffold6173_cov46-Prasinocladus_malaysianus.AAC.2
MVAIFAWNDGMGWDGLVERRLSCGHELYLRLDCAGMTSGKRIFNADGASTAFTRSIGDRDAGNVIIAKPEINTMEIPVQV